MSNLLRQHLYIALAFQTILTTDKKDFYAQGTSKRIVDLAKQISDFCNLYAPNVADMPAVKLVNEAGAEELDATIEHFLQQRSPNAAVVLPDDEETLLKLYDRLQLRAARRVNRLLFAQISKEKLAKFIMSHLDQELEDREMPQ